jgi:hypothetical protein
VADARRSDLVSAHRRRFEHHVAEVGDERERNEVHHDRVDDFVSAEACLERSGIAPHSAPGRRTREQRQRHQMDRRQLRPRRAHQRRHERAEVELAFDADIEQPGRNPIATASPVKTSGVALNSVWPMP